MCNFAANFLAELFLYPLETFHTYGNVGSNSASMGQFSGVSTSLSRSFRSTRSASNSVISVRTSDQSYQSFGGGSQSSYLTPTGTGSFVSMHGDVSSGVMQKLDFTPVAYAGKGQGDKPGSQPVGAQDHDAPIGDAVLPMLLMVGLYLCVRIFKSRKKLNLDKV